MFHYRATSIVNVLLDGDDGEDDGDDNDDNDSNSDSDSDNDNNEAGETRMPIQSLTMPSSFDGEDYATNLDAIAQDIRKRSRFYNSARKPNEDPDPTLQSIEDVKIFRVRVEVRIY
jgi:hypothetical protein